MKFKELTQMSRDEQSNKLKELQLELIKLNAQVATGTPPKNAGQLKRMKKDIARIMLIQGTAKPSQEKAKAPAQKKTIKTAKKQNEKTK